MMKIDVGKKPNCAIVKRLTSYEPELGIFEGYTPEPGDASCRFRRSAFDPRQALSPSKLINCLLLVN